jgi:hypothetical protein
MRQDPDPMVSIDDNELPQSTLQPFLVIGKIQHLGVGPL